MSEAPPTVRRWLAVRSSEISAEEAGVLTALEARLAGLGVELVTVLLGTASHGAEAPPDPGGDGGPQWVLEEDARGRGLRPSGSRPLRIISHEELVDAIMMAEQVISLP